MPNIYKTLAAALIIAVGTFAAFPAFAADVEVEFSSKLERNMATLNSLEQQKEERFRQNLDDSSRSVASSARRFNKTRFSEVAWAGETLIPDLGNYSVENLTIALVKETLNRAGMGDLEGSIRLTIQRLKVANHSLSFLRGSDTYVIGTLEHLDSNGRVLSSTKVSANLVIGFTANNAYQGPNYAFSSTDPANRVGPALARFVQKGLENLFSGQEFVGPIVISGS